MSGAQSSSSPPYEVGDIIQIRGRYYVQNNPQTDEKTSRQRSASRQELHPILVEGEVSENNPLTVSNVKVRDSQIDKNLIESPLKHEENIEFDFDTVHKL